MFRTSYVRLQEEYIVHTALCFFHEFMQRVYQGERCWLRLHNCIKFHVTKNI